VAALALGAGAAIVLLDDDPLPVASPPTVTPTAVVSTSPSPVISSSTGHASVEPGTPLRVRVPAVGVDAPVLPTAFENGEINPPTLDDVYWIADYGAPGTDSDNTVYLLGHSWDNGPAVFNALFDRPTQTSRVQPGDEIDVETPEGMVSYEVDRTERYPRASVGDPDSEAYGDVWAVVPGQLILITCFQQNDGADARDNFVVFAHVQA
jgi:sortase (surface protein transpeptidase)